MVLLVDEWEHHTTSYPIQSFMPSCKYIHVILLLLQVYLKGMYMKYHNHRKMGAAKLSAFVSPNRDIQVRGN